MGTTLLIAQIVISLIVTLLVLVQTKGTGFGRAWGGSSSFTRRGLERAVFRSTFVVSGIFIVVSVFQMMF